MRIPALVLIFAVAAASCSTPAEESGEEIAPVVAVRVAEATRGNVELQVTAPATVFPLEQANIAARITAPIRELQVRKGDRVTRGQTLVLLEDRDLRAQRAEAVAAVTDAQASLEKISSGTLPADLERARGQVETAQAAFDLAQKNYQRRNELFAQGAIPQRDLNVTETELAQARTNLEVARTALDLLQNQSSERDVRIAQSRLDQASARLDSIDAQLSFTELLSPFPGVVTEQFAYPGDMAKPDTTLLTVMNMATAVARAQVPEADAPQVSAGQTCRFQPTDPAGVEAAGRITVVNRTVDPARRTVEVWCEIASPPRWVRAGSFGDAVIITGQAPESVLVPRDAVQFLEGTRRGIVMAVDAESLAHEREVLCGPIVGGRVQILEGVEAGELVITEGGFGLPEGTRVTTSRGSPE